MRGQDHLTQRSGEDYLKSSIKTIEKQSEKRRGPNPEPVPGGKGV